VRSEYLMPHWQEGMLLKPQHFQSFSRYLENRDNRFIQTSHSFYWGVRELEISSDEISNEMISIRKASVYLRDGTLLRIPDEGEPPARNFKKALDESAGSLDVFLAVPRRQRSLPVVGPDTNARYRIIQNECEDENTGSNPVML
jgi:type VI secretion system protein ImpJ